MSYCRFSSDNWKSDVYVYQSNSGYEIHVAARRHVGPIPETPDLITTEPAVWLEAHQAQMAWLDEHELEPITLPHAGEDFTEETAEECRERLIALQNLGYHIPQHALDRLAEEIKQG